MHGASAACPAMVCILPVGFSVFQGYDPSLDSWAKAEMVSMGEGDNVPYASAEAHTHSP